MNPNFFLVSDLSYKTMRDISAKQRDQKRALLKSNIQKEEKLYQMTTFFDR